MTELRAAAAKRRSRAISRWKVIRSSGGPMDERAYVAVSDLSPTELDAFVAAFRQAAVKERGGGGGVGAGK